MRGWRGVVTGVMLAMAAGCAASTGVEVDRLEGRWEWLTASGGIAGWTITPATQGYTMELRFLDDGDAELYRNGALQSTADYRIVVGREDGSFAGRDVVRFTPALLGWEEMGLALADADRLLLVDGCCDGYAYTFVRVGSAP